MVSLVLGANVPFTNGVAENLAGCDPGWVGPTWVDSESGLYSQNPGVAMDAEGNAVAVWWQPGASNVFANIFSPLGGWGTPIAIGNNSLGRPYDPVVKAAGKGVFFAAWGFDNDSALSVWTARYDPLTRWSSPVLVSTSAIHAHYAQMAADPGGNATILWQETEGVHYTAWASHFARGGNWTTPQRLTGNDSTNTSLYSVAADGNGSFYATWDEDNGTGRSIWWSKLPPIGSWINASRIDPLNAADAYFPMVAAKPSGNLTVAYLQYNGTVDDLFVASYSPAAGWGSPLQLAPTTGHARLPTIASGPSGETLVGWAVQDFRGGGAHGSVWTAQFSSGTMVPVIERLNPGQEERADSPRLAVGSLGAAIAVWQQSTITRWEVWASSHTANSGWGAPVVLLGPGATSVAYGAVAGDGGERAMALVQEDHLSGPRMAAWAFGMPMPPRLVIDSPPDGTQSLIPTIGLSGRTCPGSVVSIDGAAAVVDANGSFTANLTLHQGSNTVAVNANSSFGIANAISLTVNFAVPPEAPISLTAREGHLAVNLAWAPPSVTGGAPVSGYRIYRQSNGSGEEPVATLGASTSYRDSVNNSKTNYTYRVSALNWAGEGNKSAPASAVPRTTPSAPLNLKTSPGNGQVLLEWSPPSDDGGAALIEYRLYRGAQSGQLVLLANGSGMLRYTDTGLSNGAKYFYQVSAVNDAGEGNRTAETPITLPGGFLPGPDALLAVVAMLVGVIAPRSRGSRPR